MAMTRVRGPQDMLAGVVVIAIAAAILQGLSSITTTSYSAFSPALFPRVCTYAIALGGVVLILRGLFKDGPGLDRLPFRPVLLVTLAVVVFGLVAPRWGYAPGGLLTLLIAGFAAPDMRWRELVAVSALLIVISIALFTYLLNLTIPVLVLPGVNF